MVAGHANHIDDTGARTLMGGVSLPDGPDAGGSYEGVTRMMYGWGGWLSQPARSHIVSWRRQTFDIAAFMRQAVIVGCDPLQRGYWGSPPVNAPGMYDQRTVEAGHTLFTLWQAKSHVWDSLTRIEQLRVLAYHERFGIRPQKWGNNWALFWMLNHAVRFELGENADIALIDDVLWDYLDRVYCEDGWYDDSAVRGAQHFDDYNLWVFASHVLMWASLPHSQSSHYASRRAELLDRVQTLMAHVPYFFASNGHYVHYGRSLMYKFARLGALIWAYKLGVWPHPVGMLKRIVGRHLRWHIDRGAMNGQGALVQAITNQGSDEIRDPYNATGSQYWAMQAFGALWSVPDDDDFWHIDEAPLPVEKSNFAKIFRVPGWVVVGSHATGEIQRFVTHSTHQPPSIMPAKYDKFVYSTLAPFNAGYVNGQPSPDGMLCLTMNGEYRHRCGNVTSKIQPADPASNAPIWVRMKHLQQFDAYTHSIDTTLLILGECHIRAHRVMLDTTCDQPVGASEGAAPLGYAPGVIPQFALGKKELAGFVGVIGDKSSNGWGRKVAIRSIRGYDDITLNQQWGGRHDLNSVYAHFGLPMLHVSVLNHQHELVCAVHIGQFDASGSRDLIDSLDEVIWSDDDSVVFCWKGDKAEIIVPALHN
jgi:hypothetical protein